jgi:hypothetical protein
MTWLNDTPHSLHEKDVPGLGSGAKKAGLRVKAAAKAKAKAERDAEKARQKDAGVKAVKPLKSEAALERLKRGDTITLTLPNSWTWAKTSGPVSAGTVQTLRSFGHLVELSPALFTDRPGQLWGWCGE